MSLVCQTIVSRYTPQQRDRVDTTSEPEVDPWQTESSFGHLKQFHARPAPLFVPASLQYDEYGMPMAADVMQPQDDKPDKSSQDVSAWYRSLTSRGGVESEKRSSGDNGLLLTASTSTSHSSHRLQYIPHSHYINNPSSEKCNWFATSLSQVTTHVSKPSALGDLLSRNPPPRPSEPSFRPPVFLTIGPSNKGFAMLQRKGWREGEGLGTARVERKPKGGLGSSRALEVAFQDRNTKQRKYIESESDMNPLLNEVKHEIIDLTFSDSESEKNSKQNVVDLTLSDSELDGDGVRLPDDASSNFTPHGTTLLTPIATTLKADRLGIGLKAARPSRSARAKAVTHTSAAVAAHIRHGNQVRVERAWHGRGSRGFARARQKEGQERVNLLAYMNSN